MVISPADPGTPLGRLPAPTLHVTGPGGAHPRPVHPAASAAGDRAAARGDLPPRHQRGSCARSARGTRTDWPASRGTSGSRSPRTTAPAGAPGGLRRGTRTPPTGRPAATRSRTDGFLGLVNSARAAAGSPPVSLDARLDGRGAAHTPPTWPHAGVLSSESRGRHLRLPARHPGRVRVSHRRRASGLRPAHTGRVRGVLPVHRAVPAHAVRARVQPGRSGVRRRPRSGDLYWTALWARPFSPGGLARTANEVVALTNAERAAGRSAAAGRRPAAHHGGAGAQRRHGGPRLLLPHLPRRQPSPGTGPPPRAARAAPSARTSPAASAPPPRSSAAG